MDENMGHKYGEIFLLASMLAKAGIEFCFSRLIDGWHLACKDKKGNQVCSVVEHKFSIGSDYDLLEIMGLLTDQEAQRDSVKGFLTAANVFERISTHYKTESEDA